MKRSKLKSGILGRFKRMYFLNPFLDVNVIVLISFMFFCTVISCSETDKTETEKSKSVPAVIPRPRIEKYGQKIITLTEPGQTVAVIIVNSSIDQSKPIDEGIKLFSKRLGLLNDSKIEIVAMQGDHQIKIDYSTEEEMTRILQEEGVDEKVEGKRLSQSYYLETKKISGKNPLVEIRSCSDLGLYYGLVSLCQLADSSEAGQIVLPEVKIVDYPEIGIRLAKTSATFDRPYWLRKLTDWMPVFKMRMVGLQFHGENSRELGLFERNVKSVCPRQRELGLLETIVYFCPFRGNGYDFETQSGRDDYVKMINWIFDQGAYGIEVDYNDWPGEDVPIEDVLNLAYRAVMGRNSDAYILYCPPNKGPTQYRGAVTEETKRILSLVPEKIWPLWTGMTTVVTDTLYPEQVEQWAKDAGRRPFLYLNRVMLYYPKSYSQTLREFPEARVFKGELLPKELGDLFEGIHFNAADPNYRMAFDDISLAYMATAADYVWNPHDWEAAESYRRAKRFVEIMQPLVMPWP
jgi:hypothetical protein